jgi:sugar O-acyltransferase (sialic acid O-acetyltransferase NeuD family)
MAGEATVDEVVVVGGGGHAKVLIGVLHRLPFVVLGYVDPENKGAVLGAAHLGDDSALGQILRTHAACGALIGVGKVDADVLRASLHRRLEGLGYAFPVVTAPTATVAEDVVFGAGTEVLDGAIVNSGTRTGRSCILNSASTVEHDCRLGENVHVASGATVCGGVVVGDHTMIGAGATVVQGIRICDRCIVGAGAVVTANIRTPGTYIGVPIKRVR